MVAALTFAGIAMVVNSATQPDASWPQSAFIIIATLAALVAQTRQLPAQNVLVAAGLIAAGAVASEAIAFALSPNPAIPLHARWFVPLVWVNAMLNSRGAAKLILHRRQHSRNYGFQMIGLTVVLNVAVLVAIWSVTMNPFHADVKLSVGSIVSLARIMGWTFTTFLMLLFVTPVLMNKKPVRYPANYQPMILWNVLILFAALAAGIRGFPLFAAIELVLAVVITLVALRGANSRVPRGS